MLGICLPDMYMQALYSSVGELFKHWVAAMFQFTWLLHNNTSLRSTDEMEKRREMREYRRKDERKDEQS